MTDTNYILLVEDNPNDVALTSLALRKHAANVEIRVARDGEEALRMLGLKAESATSDAFDDFEEVEPAVLPRLILLDLKLPLIPGIDVLKSIKSNPATCATPVVILSTSTEQKDLKNAYSLGANSYLAKPVDFERFNIMMEAVGRYWLDFNEYP